MELLLSLAATLATQAPAPAETVRILRDEWGVPHVLAESDYGALYGYGWALAEDQLEAALSAIWTAQGRRTEVDGESALALDRTHRLVRLTGDVERDWDALPVEARELGRGFADGLNAYMAAHPDEVPDWAEPVRAAWTLGLGRLIYFLPQIRRANSERKGLGPKLVTVSSSLSNEHYIGSNAWALGPERTAGAAGVLALDPHLPWKYEFRLYEVHMRGASFEVAGAALMGVPATVFARNESLAWGWTWNGPDHADVYRLTLDPADPERYLLDGESVAFEAEEHVFHLAGDGEVRETLRWSTHGPITHRDVEAGYAVAYRMTAFGQTGGPQQFLELVRAGSVDELNRAMARMQFGHFNLVAADNAGSVQYLWGGRIPRRPDGFDYRRPLDGSTSATLWDPDDVVSFEELPRVRDPEIGYVQSCNNHPHNTTATGDDPAADSYPPGVVVDGEDDTLRSWYLRRRIAERDEHTLEQAIALATDAYMIPHEPMTRQLARAWEMLGAGYEHPKLERDVELLLDWDGMPTLMSPAPTLFTAWLYDYAGGKVFLPVELMERELAEIDEAEARHMLDTLWSVREELRKLTPLPRIPWGLFHVIRRGGRVFPVASGMYPAISLMNANLDPGEDDPGAITCRVGSAYTMVSSMDETIRTWSVLPLGQTDDPDSPYYHAMTEAYAERRLKPLAFTDEELAAIETTETVLRLP